MQHFVKKNSSLSNYDVYQDITDKATVDKQLNTQVILTLARTFDGGKCFAIQVGYDKNFAPACDKLKQEITKKFPNVFKENPNPQFANRMYIPREISPSILNNIFAIVSKEYKNVVYDDRESQTFFTQKGAKFDSSTLMMLR